MQNGEVLCDYLQPFPVKGTGYHRMVFVLYRQDKGRIDFSKEKRPQNRYTAILKDCYLKFYITLNFMDSLVLYRLLVWMLQFQYCQLKRDPTCCSVNLSERTFETCEFFREHRHELTPVGVSFFQTQWDSTVRDTFHKVLGKFTIYQIRATWGVYYVCPQFCGFLGS